MATVPDGTGSASLAKEESHRIAGRFVLGQPLGAGGMGQVYAAEDTLLKRRVAIKRMAPNLQFHERDRGRFLKEAQRASVLSHPNIAAIYDVIEDQGEILIVMEYIEGTTLRSRCRQPLSTEQFLEVAEQCADSLSAAHAEHILHGDIKPENIMLTASGRVKILDFGVAKHFTLAGPDDATQSLATLDAVMSGTPAYMAPEVLTQKPYDGRADLFSLGLVFYELLGGRQPFAAESFVETVDRILHTDVPAITTVNKNVPVAIAQIVSLLLQKDPAQRYATASALLADLRSVQQTGTPRLTTVPVPVERRRANANRRRFIIGAIALALVVAVITAYKPLSNLLQPPPGTNATAEQLLPQTPIIAVVPFKRIEGNAQLSALGEGLVESVAAKLSQVAQNRSLEVIDARNLQEKHVSSLLEARSQFGANVGLTVTLEEAGELTHASYTLIDARNGRTIAGESFTVPTSDVFSVEDSIAQGTVRALRLTLRSDEQRALKLHGTTQPAAYGYYLQARGYLVDYSQAANVENAIVMATNALKLDPMFGRAKAALGEGYWRKYALTKEKKWTGLATTECQSAVTLGNSGEAGHLCLGLVHDGTGKYGAAAAEYKRALELEPANESAALGLALALEHEGAVQNAEKAYERLMEAHAQSYFTYNALGAFYYRRAELDKAAEMFEKVTQLAPEGYVGYLNLGGVLIEQGRYAEAVAPLEKSIALKPTYGAYANLGSTYFASGRFDEAVAAYTRAAKLDPNQYVIWGDIGAALFYAGQKDGGRRMYRRAIDLASEQLKVNPRDTDVLSDLSEYYAMVGDREHALHYLQQALEYGHSGKELLFAAAQIYNDLGETGLALEWLSKAVQAGYSPTKFRDYPAFRNLAENPQFKQMVGR